MFIYKITNQVNGKIYIGLTTGSVEHRFSSHWKDAKRNDTGMRLHRAMRKYGRDSFLIETIREDATSLEELEQQEIDEINLHNSTDRNIGYNHSTGGKVNTMAITVDGKHFVSKKVACAFYKTHVGVFHHRINKGWSLEQALGLVAPPIPADQKSILVNGKHFDSHRAAYAFYNVNEACFYKRIRKGWTLEEALGVDSPPASHGKIVNKRPSLKQQKASLPEVPLKSFRDIIEKIVVEGKEYSSIKQVANHYGIDRDTVRYRIRNMACSIEQALGLEPLPEKKIRNGLSVSVFGKTYRSIKECAMSFGLNKNSIAYRMSRGEGAEVAIEHLLGVK